MNVVDLSKQQVLDADPKAIQKTKFTANLDTAGNTRIYFILENETEVVLRLSLNMVGHDKTNFPHKYY